ncbi:hypothetical protein A1O3_07201 [Capronia epimyces CBS 606.96]|uniref:Transcription factor domain-containing protein n=1 Tax=Capronia epimyces CBS 606.96 TaxID=1182542 RepID=W9XL55_9EURO|nr:uncharacterized protein A1O3_07201 [Capronia epimyces CBS 606.96]EXJ80913.1 hypothetical protein A1O3_07201 [Capronia epimyces CBS 606.96]
MRGADDLTLEECEALIHHYRRMSAVNFGYVIIPEGCSAAALIEERPLLARAIFTVASWRNHARQAALQLGFMRELSDRYFVKSERSLDLLQALIVYFGWCHWYATPFANQAYRQASLIATLAIELGITQRPTNMNQHDMIVGSASAFSQTNETVSSKFWSYEARRAYVGTYQISTFCLLLFRKPVLLAHTQYLDECASSLAADPQYPSDATLIHQVGSMRLAEQVSVSFDHGSRERVGELSDDKVQLLVKTLVKHLNDYKASLSMGGAQNGPLSRLCHMSRAYIHEVGLYGLLQGQTPSATRISIIYECYTSSMRFLSDVLDLSLDDMADWTSMDWRYLNLAVMLCTKSSIILDSAQCATEASQGAAWLYKCLDTLCVRVKELHRQSGAPPAQDHGLKRMAGEWSAIKVYHQTCIHRNLSQTGPTSASGGVNANGNPTANASANAGVAVGANIHAPIQQFFDNGVFEMDPLNDIFWTGFTDADGSMNNMFQI